MASDEYRIESNQPIRMRLPAGGRPSRCVFSDRSLAVAVAAKNVISASGQEVRVVHVPTGEVVFRKTTPRPEH
jgi:hypothetical protein